MQSVAAPALIVGAQAGAAVFDAPTWRIDLYTGRFSLKRRPWPMDKGQDTSREGVLDRTVVSSLRQRARAALADTMTTAKCGAEHTASLPPPTADSMLVLSVWLDGAFASAPFNAQCWSAPATALQSAALAAVDPPPKREP